MKTNLKTKSKNITRTAIEVCTDRSAFGLLTAERIRVAALKTGDSVALCVSDRLAYCASHDNMFLGFGMEYRGKNFNGHGTLWSCGLRLCANCIAKKRAKCRKRALEVVHSAKLLVGESWKLITLTAPNLPDVELHKALKIQAYAWDLFRKRKIYVDNFGITIKGVEFELGNRFDRERNSRDWSLKEDGYHPHVHLLAAAPRVDKDYLRKEWTECVLKSWKTFGIDRTIDTKSGYCFTNIKQVNKEISIDGAVYEVTKYITKGTSWLNLPESELLAFANSCADSLKGWSRMFEVLGRANGNKGKRKLEPSAKNNLPVTTQLGKSPVLDTKVLSDGLEALKMLSVSSIDGSSLENSSSVEKALFIASKLPLKVLAMGCPRWIWLHELKRRVSAFQHQRKSALASRYPDAKFATLSGSKWRSNGVYMIEVK